MHELLLSSKSKHPPTPWEDRPYAGWDYNVNASTGQNALGSNHTAAMLQAVPYTGSPYTKALNPTTSQVLLTPLSLIQALTGDYTFEFMACLQGDNGYTRYMNFSNTSSGGYLTLQVGDSGFGHRLQFATSGGNWCVPTTRPTLKAWKHIAIQRKGANTQLAVGGVWQQFAAGTSTSYGNKYLTGIYSPSAANAWFLGNNAAGVPGWIADFAVWNKAKYVDGSGNVVDFTPPTGPFVWL